MFCVFIRRTNSLQSLYLQMSDYGLPEQDLGLPSLQLDTSSPPAEDAQVADVFYEDAFQDPGLETTQFDAVPGPI